MTTDFDPLDFLVDKPRTRLIILAELESAEKKFKQTEPVKGQPRHPWRERMDFCFLVGDLTHELDKFDWAAKSPLEQLNEYVRTAKKRFDYCMSEWVDKKNDLDGEYAKLIRGRRLVAPKLLAQTQNDLAVFLKNGTLPPTMPRPLWLELREVKEVQEVQEVLTALPIIELPRHSAAAQTRLGAHIEADRLARQARSK